MKWNLKKEPIAILLLCLFAFGIFGLIFLNYFFSTNGLLGHDYALIIPDLLDGFYWHKINGLLKVPWFSPSFCGGVPRYAHFQSNYYSLTQFIAFFIGPVKSVVTTVFIFAGVGYLYCYRLLTRVFNCSRYASFWGATLFLFNGFFISRVSVGHIGFGTFMFVPWVCYLILSISYSYNDFSRWKVIFNTFLLGLIFAYMFQAGLSTMMIPVLLSIIIIIICHGLLGYNIKQAFLLFISSGLISILLSSSRIVSALYLMRNFTREGYRLPGADGLWNSITLPIHFLFVGPLKADRVPDIIANRQWLIDRHEMEYGMTFVPVLLAACCLWLLRKKIANFKVDWSKWWLLAILTIILMVPIAVNTYYPAWNLFLKQIPIIKSSSVMLRWYCLYIPFVVLVSSLLLDRALLKRTVRIWISIVCVLLVVSLNFVERWGEERKHGYNPKKLETDYLQVKNEKRIPKIDSIGVYLNSKKEVVMPSFRNNTMVDGISQKHCYEPLFGYRLEALPFKSLAVGSVFKETDGVLNIKNPACYVWPEENSCSPGDHFTVQQKESAKLFTSYHPYFFKVPVAQRVANWLTLIGLLGIMIYFAVYMFRRIIYKNH